MNLKKRLAHQIVGQFHSKQAADDAQEHFAQVFQRRDIPKKIPEIGGIASSLGNGLYRLDLTRTLLEKGLVKSRRELKQFLADGAIEINGEKIKQTMVDIPNNSTIKVGKRLFVRIAIE